MEKVRLKNSDLYVSRLCFGGCPMGGHGWGEVSKEKLILAVKEAVRQGVNFFDTADIYGLGEGEKILSEALGEEINNVIIASKFGVKIVNGNTLYDNSEEWIRASLEGSLKRLKREYIDLYQLHYRDNKTPIHKVIETLENLKKEKKIRYYGFSNLNKKDIEELKKYKNQFVSFQNEYSLAQRKDEKKIKNIISELDINVLTWGSLGQGILTGKYDSKVKFDSNDRRSRHEYVNFHGKKLINNLDIVNGMKKLSKIYNKPLAAIAIRWILDYIPDSVVITGIKNREQLKINLESLNWTLSSDDIVYLKKISDWRDNYE